MTMPLSAQPDLKRILALTVSIQVIATAVALSLTAIAPLVARDLGLSANFIGYQISFIYLVGMVASAYAGSVLNRLGAEWTEALCLASFALGLIGFAAASVPAIVLAAAAIGVGYGLQNPAASQLLEPATPHRARNLVFSIKQTGVPVGGLFASFAFPFLADWIGWRTGLLISALVPVIFAIVLLRHGNGGARAQTPGRGGGNAFLSGQRLLRESSGLRTLAILSFFYSFVQISLSAFMVTVLVEETGIDLLTAGFLAALMQGAGAVGRLSFGFVADRYANGMLLLGLIGIAGCIAGAALTAALLTGASFFVLAVLAVVVGTTWIGWNGVMLAEAARLSPPGRIGEATGAVLVHTFAGALIGPSVIALLADVTGSFAVAVAVLALCGLPGLFVLRHWSHTLEDATDTARVDRAPDPSPTEEKDQT